MKNYTKIVLLILGLLLYSCSDESLIDSNENTSIPNSNEMRSSNSKPSTNTPPTYWDFNNLTGWVDATQVGNPNYFIENGILNIATNANTWDRTKIKTESSFTTGTYSWRVYVPAMGIGDMASIGAFLYNNDTHELDFEIGYGSNASRQELNAASDDLVVFMTSQANPFQSIKNKIKREQWYTLSIELKLNSKNKYFATWKINGNILATTTLTYGTKSKFNIFCSVENLTFIGDHIPNSRNYALFDSVGYTAN